MRVEIVKDCAVGWVGQVRDLPGGVARLLIARGLVRPTGPEAAPVASAGQPSDPADRPKRIARSRR